MDSPGPTTTANLGRSTRADRLADTLVVPTFRGRAYNNQQVRCL